MSLAVSHPYRVVGRYRVYSELASGGMATVHLGCLLGAAGFSKLVAIKCLHEEFALEESFVSMFLDEARLASSIHHPNVVASLDVVAEQGELLVVMEYVHGEALAVLLRTARQTGEIPPLGVTARIICDALDGLHAAHSASLAGSCLNIVHRDVSPQNIMVGVDGNSRVLDFGIAQAALRSHVTAAGTVKGKIAYMSPEQAQGLSVDARTDVFAAGVVLWEALTGRRLFFAPDSRDALELLLSSRIPPPSSIVPTLPEGLDAVVLRALERDRDQRFATARDFAEALRGVVDEGSRKDVTEWVMRLAKDGLARRSELLQALEASTMHTSTDLGLSKVTASSPRAAPSPTPAEQTQAQVTVTTSLLPSADRQTERPRRRVWWAAGAALLTALAAVWLLGGAGTAGPPRAAGPHAAATAPAVAHAPAPRAIPDVVAAAAATPPAGLLTAPDSASSSQAASAPPVDAEKLPLVPNNAPKPVVKKHIVRDTTPAITTKKSCSPPYRIDASGVKRVKPECL